MFNIILYTNTRKKTFFSFIYQYRLMFYLYYTNTHTHTHTHTQDIFDATLGQSPNAKKPELVVLAIGADGAAARGSVERLDKILTINKKDIGHLTVSLDYNGPILAPIKKGAQIATITIKKKNEIIKSLPLYSVEDLKKVNFFKSLVISLNYLIWGDV